MKLKTYIIIIVAAAVVLMLPSAVAASSSVDLSGIRSYGHFEKSGDVSYFKYNDTSVLVDEEAEDSADGTEIETEEQTAEISGGNTFGTTARNVRNEAADLSLRKLGSTTSSLPEAYSLLKKGRMTPVRNQGSYNTCASFATLASLESNLATQKLASNTLNLSELHLAYFIYNGKNSGSRSLYDGKDTFYSSNPMLNGSSYMQSIATLARWYGAVSEKTAPYTRIKSGLSGSLRIKHSYLLTNAYVHPNYIASDGSINRTAMNQIKTAIMKHGAVASMMAVNKQEGFGTSVANEQTTFYWPAARRPDHGITIAGWDDSCSSDHFIRDYDGNKYKPRGDGAWLVKNSWGTATHDRGYFWISYYDPSLMGFYSMTGDKKSGGKTVHKSLYQYDGLGIGEAAGFTTTKVSGANCFKARVDTLISQVSTWTMEANSRVNIKIYVNKYQTPTSGTCLYNKTFKVAKAGYHTIGLGKKIGIPKGCKMCVIVTAKCGKYYFVPFEIVKKSGSNVRISGKVSGESYIYGKMKGSGKYKWVDTKNIGYSYMNSDIGTATVKNALAKIHSVDSGKAAQKIKVKATRKIKRKKSFKLKAKRVKGNGKLVYYSANRAIATVDTKGKVTTKKKGKVKIYIRALPTAKCKATVKIVTVIVKK